MQTLKGCPKCGGNVFPEKHVGGVTDFTCLQCGKLLTPREVAVLVLRYRQVAAARKGAAPAGPARVLAAA